LQILGQSGTCTKREKVDFLKVGGGGEGGIAMYGSHCKRVSKNRRKEGGKKRKYEGDGV